MTIPVVGRFQALLVDAGGTLFPDRLSEAPGVRRVREERLAALLPELDAAAVARLLRDLTADGDSVRDHLEQRTEAAVAARLATALPELAGRAPDVRRALGRPTGHEHPPFPGHRELLVAARDLGLRRIVVSNTNWVSDEDWLRWRVDVLGLHGLLDGVVTSYDVGHRKPHPAMFERALALAGSPAAACIFVGDNEAKDVAPALALGMTVIRVAIQEPPSPTRAQHLVTDLHTAAEVLRTIVRPGS